MITDGLQPHDVWVVQLRTDLCLFGEHLEEVRFGSEFGDDAFDDTRFYEAVRSGLTGETNFRHATDADVTEQHIATKLFDVVELRDSLRRQPDFE